MNTSLNVNLKSGQPEAKQAETAGTIASNSSPQLFVPSQSTETAGTIASASTSASSSGGGFSVNA